MTAPMTAPVPDTLEELLTPDWLNAALAPRFPGLEVTGITPGPVIARLATNARFHIETADGLPEGLSPDLCAKGYFNETGRAYRHIGESEVCFYRDIAASTGTNTLRSVYAEMDPTTKHGVIITEDVVVHGATFLDARSSYTPDQAAESLGELAKLHATTWLDPAYADTRWLEPKLESYLQRRGVDEIRSNFEGPIGAGVPEEVRDADVFLEAFRALATMSKDDSPWSVIHGDSHVGNVYLDGAGRPSFVDWQMVQRGPWYLDVGYHLASALTVEDRRRTERDLVAHYLDRLAAGGVDVPSHDEAWWGIRCGIVHGLYLWGVTLAVDPAITSKLLERLGTAAADHDAYAAPTQAKEHR